MAFLPDPGVSGVRSMGPMGLWAIWVDGCHLIDGGRAQCGLGDHQGGRQGGGTGAARNIGAGEL